MEMAPEGPGDVAHGGPGEVAHGGPGKEESEEYKPNDKRKTRITFVSQMRGKVLSGPSNQHVGPDVSC